MASKHETIYRHKQMGTRIGTPAGVKPGDLVTFCTDGGFYTRTVKMVNEKSRFVLMEAMTFDGITICKAQEVPFKDIREVLRPKKKDAGKAKRRGR